MRRNIISSPTQRAPARGKTSVKFYTGKHSGQWIHSWQLKIETIHLSNIKLLNSFNLLYCWSKLILQKKETMPHLFKDWIGTTATIIWEKTQAKNNNFYFIQSSKYFTGDFLCSIFLLPSSISLKNFAKPIKLSLIKQSILKCFFFGTVRSSII